MVLSLHHDHWNEPRGEAHYTIRMLKSGLSRTNLVENTPTLFVQRNWDTNAVEGCWEGKVHDFLFKKDEKGRVAVWFSYDLDRQVSLPAEYANFPVGWHCIENIPAQRHKFDPPFVSDLIDTNDWQIFETHVSWLLKLLGVHNLYAFDRENQPGRPDGFFKLGRSAIIYDATLNGDFVSAKKDQVNNYCNQFKAGYLDYDGGTVDVRECEKQVWIVTKGTTHILRRVDDITIKEVNVQDLLDLNEKRILENLHEDQLSYELRNLGRVERTAYAHHI